MRNLAVKIVYILVWISGIHLPANAMTCRDIFQESPLNPLPPAEGSFPPTDYSTHATRLGYSDHVLIPERGYLAGFEIVILAWVRAKLELKHDLSLEEVQRAFHYWTQGPVREAFLHKDETLQDNIRYSFVAHLAGPASQANRHTNPSESYIKIVFDLTKDDRLLLISAYRVSPFRYEQYLKDPKELH